MVINMNYIADEIIAIHNDDGTYSVTGVRYRGLEEECEFKIPRAKIEIKAFDSKDNEYDMIKLAKEVLNDSKD